MEVQGKVAIVTGASEGIGLATAQALAAKGAWVVLAARSTEKLEQIAADLQQRGLEALAIPTDMRQQPAVEAMVETALQRFGRIDLLINNAGQSMAGRVAELDLEAFRQIIDLNVLGPVYAIQAVVPVMRRQGGGLILNISSMVSKMNIPGLAGYAATKAALNLISDTAREELAPENIRVISVFPRMTATNFGKNALGNQQMRARQRNAAPRGVAVDSPEVVADKIVEAIEAEPAEQYMDR